MGIKFLKKSKPESERVEDDAKVRMTVEETLKDIELRGDVAVKSLSQKFDGYEPENFQLNESQILAAVQSFQARHGRHKISTNTNPSFCRGTESINE